MASINIEEKKILVLQINGNISVYGGINATILKKLFCNPSKWLTSVKVKLTTQSTDNLEATCVEVLSENHKTF